MHACYGMQHDASLLITAIAVWRLFARKRMTEEVMRQLRGTLADGQVSYAALFTKP